MGCKLQALRKDEFEASETVSELTKKVGETIRLVSKSNIPGLPEDYKYLFDDTNESIQNVKLQLQEKPLNISALKPIFRNCSINSGKIVEYFD